MLVVGRKLNESVIAFLPNGERIEAKVVKIGQGRVRLGFTGPKDVTFLRSGIELRPERREPQGGEGAA